MTMCTLPNFCRVCLKYDKNLIDLEHIENEPNETLMSKLQQCVAEVEWAVFKPLLCHPCIKRLNAAFNFRKECVQSATMLKSYVAMLKDKDDGAQASEDNAYMMLPNHKYIKILVGPQSQNSFQNVFLNVVPTTSGTPEPPTDSTNIFLNNINNALKKFVPLAPADKNTSPIVSDTKTEELSVEIDPTDFSFGLAGDNTSSGEEPDWEDLISSSQITAPKNGDSRRKVDLSERASKSIYGNYVPILPKQPQEDFVTSGTHFLSADMSMADFVCDACRRPFATLKQLKEHAQAAHRGRPPFKCDHCLQTHFFEADRQACVRSHKVPIEPLRTSLTLSDIQAAGATPRELDDLVCEICRRQFNTTAGLLRHKVRKHKQTAKKKYFIKGMKNARCDICNREFSTQSYMQLHRKLHLRDDIGYKYKVFGRNRYIKSKAELMAMEVKAARGCDSDGDNQPSNIGPMEFEEEVKEENAGKEEEEEAMVIKDEEDSELESEEN